MKFNLILLLCLTLAVGQSLVDSYQSCQSCINTKGDVCQMANNRTISYCCKPFQGQNCTTADSNFASCSNTFYKSQNLMMHSCPYLPDVCGLNQTYYLVPQKDMGSERNQGKTIYGIGSAIQKLKNQQCFYKLHGNHLLNEAFAAAQVYTSELVWQIDVNITSLKAMTVELYNGTSIMWAQNKIIVTEQDFLAGKTQYSFNVTFNVTKDDLPDYGLSQKMYPTRSGDTTETELKYAVQNQVFFRVVDNPSDAPASFVIQLGLRYYNLTAQYETVKKVEVQEITSNDIKELDNLYLVMGLKTDKLPESKVLSFTERIVIVFIMIPIVLYCLRCLICPQSCAPNFDKKTPTIAVVDEEEEIPKFSPTDTHYDMIFAKQKLGVVETETSDYETNKIPNEDVLDNSVTMIIRPSPTRQKGKKKENPVDELVMETNKEIAQQIKELNEQSTLLKKFNKRSGLQLHELKRQHYELLAKVALKEEGN